MRKGIAGSGIVVDLDSSAPSALQERIAFRADMDALPLEEITGLSFASQNSGVMHACGHDCHMSILFGLMRILCACRTHLPRNYRFLFQPAEEDSPKGSAAQMIAEGALEGVRAVFGAHVWPDFRTGEIGLKPGPLMGASDRVTIRIEGKGAHAAKPHQGVDAVLVAANLLTSLQSIVSRSTDPTTACAITFGKLTAGSRYNVLADRATLEGTCRTISSEARNDAEFLLRRLSTNTSVGYGAECNFEYTRGYPVLKNNESIALFLLNC